nr:uncharacterized protein LOC117994002 [Maniola hyperantus]
MVINSFLRMTDRGKVVKKIIERLDTLAKSQFDSASDLMKISLTTEDLLYAVYKAGVSNVAYTLEESQTIGFLVAAALQGLGYQVSTLHNTFSSTSIDSVRIQRSGLQFFIDTFKDFSADSSETLEKTLKEFVEREDVDGLDERLRTAEFDPYCDDGELRRAKLPSTHWWFFE